MADLRDNPARADGGSDKRDPRGLRPVRTSPSVEPASPRPVPEERRAPPAARPAPASTPRPATHDDAPVLWLTRADQLFVALLAGTALGLMTLHWLRLSDFGRREVEIDRMPAAWYEYRIDPNTATWVEFAQFDGIGETLARRIIDDRERNGPFTRVDDLLRVNGIGPAKLAAMRRHLEIHADAPKEQPAAEP